MNQLSYVGYVDDIVFVFETIAQLQASLITLNKTFRRFGLQINTPRTKSMILTLIRATLFLSLFLVSRPTLKIRIFKINKKNFL